MTLIFVMKKKAKLQILFICCLLLPQLVFADDGKLKLDTDIITNGTQKNNNANLIESQYAPNLFLNRTKKAVDERNRTTKELLQEAEINIFKQEKSFSIYGLDTLQLKKSLFTDYKLAEGFSVTKHNNKKIGKGIFNILIAIFLIFMTTAGIFLGRKWHGLRKSRDNNSI